MNLDKLEAEREEAATDKADLFDFYHRNWAALVEEIGRPLPESVYVLVAHGFDLHETGDYTASFDDNVYVTRELAVAAVDGFKKAQESSRGRSLRAPIDVSVHVLKLVRE